jgi:hypothetical protein
MNARQDSKLKMYRAVEKHCENNSSVTVLTPAFQTALENFKAKIAAINNTAQQKDVVLKGVAADKSHCKQTLCQQAAEVAGIISAFASVTSNNTLKQEVNFSATALLQTRDDQLAARCQNIHAKGLENLTALADYGITVPTLENLQTAINDYIAEAPKPRTAVSERKTHTNNLAALFAEADDILKNQMDKLVVTFKAAHPDFVKSYESNRLIISFGSTVTQLKGTVTNQADGKPIRDALVTIVEASVRVRTNSAGEYIFKPAPSGKFTIRVTAEGFQTLTMDEVEIKMGAANGVDVALQ